MLPFAPVMFSITTGWPRAARIGSARKRATVSFGPPAANGTTIVIVRAGKVCAPAACDSVTANATAQDSLVMTPSFRLDVRCLHDRPPLCDFGLVPGTERRGRELIARRQFKPEIVEALLHGVVAER